MSSTLLLLNTHRRELFWWIVGYVSIALLLLLGGAGFLGVRMSLVFALGLALVFAHRIEEQARKQPFPVSNRQRAWMPLAVFLIFCILGWLAACASLLLPGAKSPFASSSFDRFVFSFPLVAFGVLMVLRLGRENWFLLVVFYVALVNTSKQASDPAIIRIYGYGWPVLLLVCVYLFLESPLKRASLGRRPLQDSDATPRARPVTLAADAFQNLLLLLLAALIIISFVKDDAGWSPAVWVVLGILALRTIGAGFLRLFRSSLAAGFSRPSALCLAVAGTTGFLYPLLQFLGVRKGVLSRCDRCRGWKHLWASQCLHCGHRGAGTVPDKRLAALATGKPVAEMFSEQAIEASFGIIVLLGLMLAWSLVGPSDEPFIEETVIIDLSGIDDPQERAATLRGIRKAVEGISGSADGSLWESLPDSEPGLRVPARYRLEARASSDGMSCRFNAYGLRWDRPTGLPSRFARRITEGLDSRDKLAIAPPRHHLERVAPWRIRGFLDNEAHWVERGE